MTTVRRTIVTLAILALGLGGAPVAHAEAAPRLDPPAARPQLGPAVVLPGTALAADPYLAGYAGLGGDDGMELVFQIPLGDPDPLSRAIFAGAMAFETVEDTVFVNGGGGVLVACDGGGCDYSAFVLDDTGAQIPVDIPIAGGDKVRVTYEPDPVGSAATVTIENLSREGYFDLRLVYYPTTDVRIGDIAVTLDGETVAPPPLFGKHTFRPVHLDGKKLTVNAGLTRYAMVDDVGKTVLAASKIRRGGFTVRNV